MKALLAAFRRATTRNPYDVVWGLLVALTIAGYPLASTLPLLLGVESRVVSIPFRALVLGLAVMLIGKGMLRERVQWNWPLAAFTVFWLVYVWRLATDTLFEPKLLRLQGWEYWLYAMGVCYLPSLAAQFRREPGGASEVAFPLAVRVALAACIAVLWIGIHTVLSGDITSLLKGRLTSETLNPISLGHLGASLLLLCAFGLYQDHLTRGRSLLYSFGAAVGILTALLSASRGPLVAMAACGVLLFLSYTKREAIARSLPLFILLLVFAGAGAWYAETALGFNVISRFAVLGEHSYDESSAERVQLVSNAWAQFLDAPLLGSRIEEAVSSYYPHNIVIEAFLATGIIGGVALIVFMAGALIGLVRLLLVRHPLSWCGLLFLQYAIAAQFSFALYLSGAFWLLGCIVLTSASTGSQEPVTGSTSEPAPPPYGLGQRSREPVKAFQ